MNGQLGNHGWGGQFVFSVFSKIVCVFIEGDNKAV